MLGIACAVLLAASAAGAPLDTVYLVNGGRARGTVIEDDPARGVTLQLGDGTIRSYARSEVQRIEYGEPTTPPPTLVPPPPTTPPPPPPAQAYPQYPPAYPPQYPPPYAAPPPRPPANAPLGVTFSLGFGGAYTTGAVGGNLGSTSDWWPGMMLFQLEAGLRLSPHLVGLIVFDGGLGDVASGKRADCRSAGLDCETDSARVGLVGRYVTAPFASVTPWFSLGTGWESTTVATSGPYGTEYVTFEGWEFLKLGAGVDFRTSNVFGAGLFAGVSFSTYGSVSVDNPAYYAIYVLLRRAGR